jgi:DNA-binding IclR family transcriptional regulator
VVAQAQPVLDWLSSSCNEAVHFGRLDGADIVYLAKRESRHALRLFSAIGRRLPAHATALGKSLLARRSDEEVEQLLTWPLARLTPNTLTERRALFDELEDIRRRGYAIDREENSEGITCFAVALDTAGPPQDAISLSIPILRLDGELEDRAVSLLSEAKQAVETTYHRGVVPRW